MAKRIRVLRVIARLNVGGPALQAITLARHLDPDRFETLLVTGHCAPGEVEMTELLRRTRVEPARKVATVPLGFDRDPFLAVARGERRGTLRAELGVPRGDVLVGIVGRIAPIKNHPLFLEAFARARRTQPNLRAVVLGGGSPREVEALHELGRRLGIADRVHHLGYRADLPPLYADLDMIA